MSGYLRLPLAEQAILTLAALVLVTAFALLAQSRVVATIRVFAWQGTLLGLTTALVAWDTGQHHLYVSAALTLALKAAFIPWLLVRQARLLGIVRDFDTVTRPGVILLAGGALAIFCYYVALPVERFGQSITADAVGIGLALVLLGMLMLVTRRKAVTQVVGFMAIENGLFFAAVTATHGMPMVVELGVAFDVLVAAVLFGVIFLHIRESVDSLDVDQLSRLSELDR